MTELVPAPDRRFRKEIPEKHRTNLDTRLQWLQDHRRSRAIENVRRSLPHGLHHA